MFYRESKLKFDLNPEFKEKAQQAVVRLQVNNIFFQYWITGAFFYFTVSQYAPTCLFFSSVQGGDPVYRQAWAKICEISRNEFAKVYKRLRIELEEKVKE